MKLQDALALGPAYYFLTTAIVCMGVEFGIQFVRQSSLSLEPKQIGFVEGLSAINGISYAEIVRDGYSYEPGRKSTVAFFPAFPVLASGLVRVTGLRAEIALLIVAHVFLVGAFTLAALYADSRYDDCGTRRVTEYVLLAFGLWPTTFFFRMAYTESLFLFLTIAALYLMERGVTIWTVALVIGLATATRTVGVALLVPFVQYVWSRTALIVEGTSRLRATDPARQAESTLAESTWGFCWRSTLALPLACWGLAAYMGFQWMTFHEPLAFVKTQAAWATPGTGPKSIPDKIVNLLTLGPARSVYDESSPCCWTKVPPFGTALFNFSFANPIFFLGTVLLVIAGAARGWLSTREWLLGAALLLIPYCIHADRTCMQGEARYAAVVFPGYLVMGQILSRFSAPAVALLATISGVFLAVYSALFVNWYPLI